MSDGNTHIDMKQGIRSSHMNEVRCGPHISVVDPFVEVEHFSRAYYILQKEFATMKPFKITLAKFAHFDHG